MLLELTTSGPWCIDEVTALAGEASALMIICPCSPLAQLQPSMMFSREMLLANAKWPRLLVFSNSTFLLQAPCNLSWYS